MFFEQECTLSGAAEATCALVGDFSLGISYGSMPCNLCPSSEPVCLVSDSSSAAGVVGTCSCMQQATPLMSCSRLDLSLPVVPDASQMCAVSLNSGTTSRSVSAMYDWNYLAVAPCVMISMGASYCYEVGGYGLMVVGHGVVRTTSSLIGDSTSMRRRLLGMGFQNATKDAKPLYSDLHEALTPLGSWNHTTDPCKMLVSEFGTAYESTLQGAYCTMYRWVDHKMSWFLVV